jgi:hypothetical protein
VVARVGLTSGVENGLQARRERSLVELTGFYAQKLFVVLGW